MMKNMQKVPNGNFGNVSSSTEECFMLEIWSASIDKLDEDLWVEGIDINQIDAFLSEGRCDEASRTKLLGERESAFTSYRQGDFDAALLKMIALNRMCQLLGYIPLARIGQKVTAGNKRGGDKTAKIRKREAAVRNDHLRIEGKKIQKLHPSWKISEVARNLSKREGLGSERYIYDKLLLFLKD